MFPGFRIAGNLQRMVAIVQQESARRIAVQLQQSLTQLKATQQFLQLQVRWIPEQGKRQQARLARQQIRLHFQQTWLEQLSERKESDTFRHQV